MAKRFLLLIMAAAGLLLMSCAGEPAEAGILQGKVSIGPLVPVERPGETYEVPCEVYEARKIEVYKKNGKDLVQEVSIDCDGRYHTELAPGTYVVDINRLGIDSSSQVPAEAEIESGITTRIDIDIDTGIR